MSRADRRSGRHRRPAEREIQERLDRSTAVVDACVQRKTRVRGGWPTWWHIFLRSKVADLAHAGQMPRGKDLRSSRHSACGAVSTDILHFLARVVVTPLMLRPVMRPHTRILYSSCDRITGEARGARQKDTGSNQARALHPTAQACAVGTPALPGRGPQRASLARWGGRYQGQNRGRALVWLAITNAR